MPVHKPRELLRAVLDGNRCVIMGSVYDPVSARIAELLGFQAGLIGGSLASLAVLGAPDLIVITLSELAEQVRRCTRASRVPLIVDGDHGYGNALNVIRTVEELDAAGAAAVTIEDTLLPRPFGADKTQLTSVEEGVAKLKAAVAARGEMGPLIIARSSVATLGSIEEAIARFSAYEATGTDALMIPAVRSKGDLERISAATRLPLLVGGLPRSMCVPEDLFKLRVRLWTNGHQTVEVGVQALFDAMKAVHEGTHAADLPGIAAKEMMNAVTSADDYAERISTFVTP